MVRRIHSPLLPLIAFVFLLPIQLNGQETGDQVRQLKSEVDQLRALVSDLQSRLAVPTLAAFLEYRRDWSNQPYFVTDNPAVRSTHQDTAGIGLVWWYGQKEGAW